MRSRGVGIDKQQNGFVNSELWNPIACVKLCRVCGFSNAGHNHTTHTHPHLRGSSGNTLKRGTSQVPHHLAPQRRALYRAAAHAATRAPPQQLTAGGGAVPGRRRSAAVSRSACCDGFPPTHLRCAKRAADARHRLSLQTI